jgi:hypothetical protein
MLEQVSLLFNKKRHLKVFKHYGKLRFNEGNNNVRLKNRMECTDFYNEIVMRSENFVRL